MSKTQRTWIISGVSVVVVIALVLVVMSVRGQTSSTTAAYQTTTVSARYPHLHRGRFGDRGIDPDR